jgi:hypothetical protein
MKNNKPRGKTPSLIGASNGRPKRINVQRKSHCHRCGHDIQVGQDCFGVPKVVSGFTSIKRYCRICFQSIIDQTHKDLEEIKNLINTVSTL